MSSPCFICLLKICDDTSDDCEWKTRRSYFADYYQANRDKKILAATERNKVNPRPAEYYREYRKRVKEQQQ